MLLGYFSGKVNKDNIFTLTIWNECLHKINICDGIRVVNVATSTNLAVKSTMFPHHNIHKFSTSTDYCLVVAEVRERLGVSK
jgi:hypothetical protein